MKKFLKYSFILGSASLLILYAIVCRMIYTEVKSTTDLAQHRFGGTPVEATIALLNSETTSFELKNKAVYALGQIGDPKALPALQAQVTGIPCPKPCTKNGYICQYDLEKAIKECQGQFSATRWMYRFL